MSKKRVKTKAKLESFKLPKINLDLSPLVKRIILGVFFAFLGCLFLFSYSEVLLVAF
ncbi:MAG: hypothetical protein UW85_C0006G0002 [Parcubacteria group bacterium GW2011_GWA1_Parcubacteria_45_10]|nr:MAG: hypothetical protein UW85_C0006G0002 [Parcubacteria group bacterium GW2011_GWA1_Parcubacteria_45_10]